VVGDHVVELSCDASALLQGAALAQGRLHRHAAGVAFGDCLTSLATAVADRPRRGHHDEHEHGATAVVLAADGDDGIEQERQRRSQGQHPPRLEAEQVHDSGLCDDRCGGERGDVGQQHERGRGDG
jgi:hypothetical protein